jgi:hypothetical protein
MAWTRGPKIKREAHAVYDRLHWYLYEHGRMPTREEIMALREAPKHYRVPKQGQTEASRRIAKAVDDHDWQMFRHGLKGTSTEAKLYSLRDYWNTNIHGHVVRESDMHDIFQYDCDICIRVDNYIKALCRGGQLYPGESLWSALASTWKLRIKS